jgi:hypothetical protein
MRPYNPPVINSIMMTLWQNSLSYRLKPLWNCWIFIREPHNFRWMVSFSNSKMAWLQEALSPIISNIYMEHFEKLALGSAQCKPLLSLRYVDDTFVVWPHGLVSGYTMGNLS